MSDIQINIKKYFKPIFENEYRYLVYKGGRLSGKSYGVADSLIEISRMQEARILCVREFQSSIEHSSYQLIKDRIAARGYTDFDITKTRITNTNTGSFIIFRGLNDLTVDSIKSIEGITHCWAEEAHNLSSHSLNTLLPSIRGGRNPKIIFTYNPQTINDPIHNYFIVDKKPKTFIRHINYDENQMNGKSLIPEDLLHEILQMKKNDYELYEHIYLGKPKDFSERTVVKKFTAEDNVKHLKYIKTLPLYLTCDFNVDPMCWYIAHRDEDSYYFIDEICIENTNTEQCAMEFVKRYRGHKNKIIICGDASGRHRSTQSEKHNYLIIKNLLLKEGKFKYDDVSIKLRRKNPNIQHRIASWNAKIIDYKTGKRCILIDPKCQKLIYNCYNLTYKTGTTIIDIPTVKAIEANNEKKFLSHPFDSASYIVELFSPIRYDDKVENPDKDSGLINY